MPKLLTTGCLLECTMGAAKVPFVAGPVSLVQDVGLPAGTMEDCLPFLNVAPFGTCKSLMNPTTQSLTLAAQGALTPGPCIPALTPWVPPALTVTALGQPLATLDSKCFCSFGGVVSASATGPGLVDAV